MLRFAAMLRPIDRFRALIVQEHLKRFRFAWKVFMGRYELADAMHDLARLRAIEALHALVAQGERLRTARGAGRPAIEIEALRIAFMAEAASVEERMRTNDFYQDTNPVLGVHIRFPSRPKA